MGRSVLLENCPISQLEWCFWLLGNGVGGLEGSGGDG
jgi:hypothetical protein